MLEQARSHYDTHRSVEALENFVRAILSDVITRELDKRLPPVIEPPKPSLPEQL